MIDRISWFNHLNVLYLLPNIQFFYEITKGSFRFHYLELDIVWLSFGISITIIKEK